MVITLPPGFVYLKDIDPSITQDVKYFSHDNFIGRPIKGYEAAECILTKEAALALSEVQQKLKPQSLSLKIYDCYRPQSAVDDFITWSQDISDQKMKAYYYPHVDKTDFFKLNYLAAKSSHSRGSTVDLTIDGLEMGTHFDYMDELSHPLNPNLHKKIKHNRLFLRNLMINSGFEPLYTEWWHFTLRDEPFPDTYFNFPVR
jgi:D-alanyl-D-alanine dipeptidase